MINLMATLSALFCVMLVLRIDLSYRLYEGVVALILLTLFFINTFESYVNNISNESMTDGLMRRFNLVYTLNILHYTLKNIRHL